MSDLNILKDNGVYSLLGQQASIDSIAAKLPPSLSKKLLDAYKGSKEKLEEFLNDSERELREKIPEDYRFLVARLKDLESQDIPLVVLGKKSTAKKSYQFEIGANAGLELARVDEAELEPELSVSLGQDDVVIGLTAKGSTNLSASGKKSAGMLSAAINASRSGQGSMTYYSRHDKNDFVASYLIQAKNHLANPTQLDSLIDSLNGNALLRYELEHLPALALGATVSIAPSLLQLLGTLPVNVSTGVNLSVEYADNSEFKMLVEKNERGNYVLDLKKSRKRTLSKSLKLGIEIQVVGFQNKLIEKVVEILPEDVHIQESISKLEALVDKVSKEALSTKLEAKLLSEWPRGERAIAFLVGRKNAADLSDEIRKELQERITETINAKVDLLNTKAETAGKIVAETLSEHLPLDLEHANKFEDYVKKAVTDSVANAKPKLEAALEDFIESEANNLANLLAPWEFAGGNVRKGIDAVSSSATNRIERLKLALKDIYERYTSFRQSVLKVVKEDFEEKIALNIISQKERTEQVSSAVKLEFAENSTAIETLYKSIWRGKVDNIANLFDELDRDPAVLSLSGEYKSSLKEVSKTALSLNLFGVNYEASKLFSEQAAVGMNSNGFLLIASGEGELTEIVSLLGESQTVVSAWQLDYLRDAQLLPPVSIKLTVEDKKLRKKDISQFFTPLENSGLLRMGVGDDVGQELSSNGLKKIKNAKLSIAISLSWQDWLGLVGTDREGERTSNAWDKREVADEFLTLARKMAPGFVAAGERNLVSDNDAIFKRSLEKLGRIYSSTKVKKLFGASSRSLTADERSTWTLAKIYVGYYDGIPRLQESWFRLMQNLPETGVVVSVGKLNSLRPQISEVNRALGEILDNSVRLMSVDASEVNSFTAIGLKLIAANASLPNPYLGCILESKTTGKKLFS